MARFDPIRDPRLAHLWAEVQHAKAILDRVESGIRWMDRELQEQKKREGSDAKT